MIVMTGFTAISDNHLSSCQTRNPTSCSVEMTTLPSDMAQPGGAPLPPKQMCVHVMPSWISVAPFHPHNRAGIFLTFLCTKSLLILELDLFIHVSEFDRVLNFCESSFAFGFCCCVCFKNLLSSFSHSVSIQTKSSFTWGKKRSEVI